MFAEYVIAMV